VLRGRLTTVTDPKEKAEAIKRMANEGRQKLSPNFLAAHGFRSQQGWSQLSPEKPLVIMKLVDVAEKIGLKSP